MQDECMSLFVFLTEEQKDFDRRTKGHIVNVVRLHKRR